MDQRLIDLYDEFVHVHFDRRLFLERAARLLGSSAAAAAALPLLRSNYARAEQVRADDPRLETQRPSYKGASGEVKAYVARPASGTKQGGIVVVHQNRGLNPHIEDVARRLALEGFPALAVDLLSPLGGTPPDEDRAMSMFGHLDRSLAARDAQAGVEWLRQHGSGNGKAGIIGFCWGGGIVNAVAEIDPRLDAAVVYYGDFPALDRVGEIKAPMLLNYADPRLDKRLGAGLPAYQAALQKAHVDFVLYTYSGANHAFNDDTSARYDATAAKTAWKRTLDFFRRHLG